MLINKEEEENISIVYKLLENRIIFLDAEIDDPIASKIISRLLYLDSVDTTKDISLYINSPGGYVTSGLAIVDTMNVVKSDIRTVCFGQACSMAAVILSNGTRGKRLALPNSRVMIHQPSGYAVGQTTDINIQTVEINKIKKILNQILAKNCNKPLKQIEIDTERDYFMSPKESIKYGLIDKIVEKEK